MLMLWWKLTLYLEVLEGTWVPVEPVLWVSVTPMQ